MRSSALQRTATWSVRLLAAELLVLMGTGVALYLWYRPEAVTAWDDPRSRTDAGIEAMFVVRDVHGVATILFVLTALVAVAAHLAPAHRGRAVAAGAAAAIGALAGYTGLRLAWDQIALWAVTVGENMDGYRWLFEEDAVRFVILDDDEIGLRSFRQRVILHVVLATTTILPVALLLLRARVAEARTDART